jgi:hypothetical protein
MSDGCFLFGLPYDQSSVITDWITAVSSSLTLLVAIWVGFKTYQISKYQSIQNDRKIIIDVFESYWSIKTSFKKTSVFDDLDIQKLIDASSCCYLYGYNEIAEFLDKKIIAMKKIVYLDLKLHKFDSEKDFGSEYIDASNERFEFVERFLGGVSILGNQEDREIDFFRKYLSVKFTKK